MKRHISLLIVCFVSLLTKGDNVYQQRIASLGGAIPLPYNNMVQGYIDQYLSNTDSTARILGLWNLYTPIIEAALKREGQPENLKYLAIAASGLDPTRTNSFGAGGFWGMQFDDAKNKCKLRINSMVDERRDLQKSSVAVAVFFKDLHQIYNDWLMAIAAYSSTPSNVNKAVVSAGGSMGFWEIHPFLPSETRDIVPRFVAAVYIANFYARHGITPVLPEFTLDVDAVQVERQVRFEQISQVLNISMRHLQFLNPVYKLNTVPYNESKYTLLLPKGRGDDFETRRYAIYTTPVVKPASDTPTIIKQVVDTTPTAPTPVKVSYKVKSGETLVLIADYFDCTVAMAKRWNHIRSTKVPIGKVLYFWVKPDQQSYYQSINSLTTKQRRAIAAKD